TTSPSATNLGSSSSRTPRATRSSPVGRRTSAASASRSRSRSVSTTAKRRSKSAGPSDRVASLQEHEDADERDDHHPDEHGRRQPELLVVDEAPGAVEVHARELCFGTVEFALE